MFEKSPEEPGGDSDSVSSRRSGYSFRAKGGKSLLKPSEVMDSLSSAQFTFELRLVVVKHTI